MGMEQELAALNPAPISTEGSVLDTELRVPVLGILGSRSSLEDLKSCPCSLGALNSPLLAGLHSWHSFPSSVTQKKLNPSSSGDLMSI